MIALYWLHLIDKRQSILMVSPHKIRYKHRYLVFINGFSLNLFSSSVVKILVWVGDEFSEANVKGKYAL